MTTHTDISRLLVGISNPETMPRLIDLALQLGRATGCEIVATHVVRVPGQIGLASARSSPEVVAARRLLQDALDRCHDAGVRAEAVVEVGREIHEGLIGAARSRDADLVLVGYSGPDGADEGNERLFDRVMHRVERDLDAGLLVAKFRGVATERILVPVEPASDFALIALLVQALAGDGPGSVHFLDVSPGGESSEEGTAVRRRLAESGLSEAGEIEMVGNEDVTGTVIERAQSFDLILLETTPTPAATGGLRGAEAERVAEGVACSTLLVRGRR